MEKRESISFFVLQKESWGEGFKKTRHWNLKEPGKVKGSYYSDRRQYRTA